AAVTTARTIETRATRDRNTPASMAEGPVWGTSHYGRAVAGEALSPATPRRLLMVSGSAELYGADRSLLTLARGLQARGWDVTVTVPEPGPLVETLTASAIPTRFVEPGVVSRVSGAKAWPSMLFGRLPEAAWRIGRLARQFDVVHVNTSVEVGALVGAATSGRPVVCHLRESYAAHPRQFRVLATVLRRTATRIIAVSNAISDEARAAGPAARTVVIHNSWDALPPAPPLELPPHALQVGRINDWKGQTVLVDALAALRDGGRVVPATIAGDVYRGGERYREALRRRIRDHGLEEQVRVLGYVGDATTLMGPGAIFVQPSVRPEPFGIALVEAMLRGMACVASDAGGPRDIV